MKYEIITLFPDYFKLSLQQSLLGKALEKKLFEVEIMDSVAGYTKTEFTPIPIIHFMTTISDFLDTTTGK